MNVIDKINNGIVFIKETFSNTYTGSTTIHNGIITESKVSTDSLDPELLKRLDKMEKMINELYYPMKGKMK